MGISFLVTAEEGVCFCTVAGYMNLLITRPHEDAQRLGSPLEKLGYRVTCAPLLAVQYCPPPCGQTGRTFRDSCLPALTGYALLNRLFVRMCSGTLSEPCPHSRWGRTRKRLLRNADFPLLPVQTARGVPLLNMFHCIFTPKTAAFYT